MSNWINPPCSLTDEVQRSDDPSSVTEVPPEFEPATSLEEPAIATALPVVAPEGCANEKFNNNVSISEWMHVPRQSNIIARTDPDMNVGRETNLM